MNSSQLFQLPMLHYRSGPCRHRLPGCPSIWTSWPGAPSSRASSAQRSRQSERVERKNRSNITFEKENCDLKWFILQDTTNGVLQTGVTFSQPTVSSFMQFEKRWSLKLVYLLCRWSIVYTREVVPIFFEQMSVYKNKILPSLYCLVI